MSKTGRLGLPYIIQGQAQKEVTHNQALNKLDVYVNTVVEDILNEFPSNPQESSIYIINYELSQYSDGGWTSHKPLEFMEVWLKSKQCRMIYNGKSWVRAASANQFSNNSSAEFLSIESWQEDLPLSGKVATTKSFVPHHSLVIAVNVWVIEEIAGTASFAVGVKEDLSRYGDKLSVTKDTTSIGMTYHPITYYYDSPITITPNQMEFTGGVVRINVQYLKPKGAWSW